MICPSHHFKSHHQVLITVKCSASGMCLGHKCSDIHHRNYKCKLIYTSISNSHKKKKMVCLYMYIKYTAKNITVNQTKKCFFFQNTKDNIYFILILLQTIDVFCQFIAECPSKYFFSIPLFLYCECLYQVLDYSIFHGYPRKKITLKQLKYFHNSLWMDKWSFGFRICYYWNML